MPASETRRRVAYRSAWSLQFIEAFEWPVNSCSALF